MYKEKDASQIKDILRTLENLEYDTARYKEWAECEIEAMKKQAGNKEREDAAI